MKNGNKKEGLLKIGEVAKASGVGVETIRFYERQGILPKPARRPSGYREFGVDTVKRILFIQRVQTLGFTLTEAGELANGKNLSAAGSRIEERISELRKLQRELATIQRGKVA